MKKKIEKLFENLCCSQCKASFDESSIVIKRQEEGLMVAHLTCTKCGKNFGIAFLGFSNVEVKDENSLPLVVQEGPEPISYDDVIEAHRFIKNLDEHWLDHLKQD